jgi:hypothetical protein
MIETYQGQYLKRPGMTKLAAPGMMGHLMMEYLGALQSHPHHPRRPHSRAPHHPPLRYPSYRPSVFGVAYVSSLLHQRPPSLPETLV